jgi:hypothetical protein
MVWREQKITPHFKRGAENNLIKPEGVRFGLRSQKTVLGTSWPRENTPKFMFLKPNPLVNAMIAQVSLKKKQFAQKF